MEQTNEPFDPYLKWLGIRATERPVNHYRLLGIDLLESDRDVIATAADRQMAHIRRYQTGKHSATSQVLLNELAAAKLVLLDPVRKADYDRRIENASNDTTDRSPWFRMMKFRTMKLALIPGIVVIAVMLVASKYWFGPDSLSRSTVQVSPTEISSDSPSVNDKVTLASPTDLRDKAPIADLLTDEKNGAEAAGGNNGEHENSPTSRDNDGPDNSDQDRNDVAAIDVAATSVDTNVSEPTTNLADSNDPRDSSEEFDEQSIPFDPLPIPEIHSVWTDIQLAISEGDIDAAKAELAGLRGRVRTESDITTHRALFEIADSLKQFWSAVDLAFQGRVEPRTILDYGNRSSVEVVSIGPDGVRLRSSNNAVVDYPARRDQLPPIVAAALASQVLKGREDLHSLLGTFWTFDQRGNRAQGELHWRLVRQYGSNAMQRATDARMVSAWQATVAATAVPEQRIAIPDKQRAEQLERDIESQLGINPNQPGPSAAELLLEHAEKHVTDTDVEYVCMRQTLHYASLAGRADLALETLRQLAAKYQIDEPNEQLVCLEQLQQHVKDDVRSLGLMADSAIRQAAHSVASDDYLLAAKFKNIAVDSARRSKDNRLIGDAKEITTRIVMLSRNYRNVIGARKALEDNAESDADAVATANDEIGRFYCFLKGDFSTGLTYLTKSADRDVANLAARTLEMDAPPTSNIPTGGGLSHESQHVNSPVQVAPAAKQVKIEIADAWWEMSSRLPKIQRPQVVAYCQQLYREALPAANGDDRRRVIDRLRLNGSSAGE